MVTLTDWTAILSALAGVSATVFILLQLRHMEQHRDLEVSMKLFEWAETERLRKAFRWVEEEFQFENYEKYKAEETKSFEVSDYPYEVEAYFEEVGFLVVKKFVDLNIIVDRLGSYIIADWKRLEPWILALRKERGDETFGEHFQKLYQKTVESMEKR
ncbi:MAG: hypothetical protein ABSD73_07160 [Candidatus Bathyarchaeia archaeon]